MSSALAHAALAIAAGFFDSLWEGALIAGAVWIGLRCLPKLGAATRYAIWLCALVALVLTPVLTAGLSEQSSSPLNDAVVISAPSGVVVAPLPQPPITRVHAVPEAPVTAAVAVSETVQPAALKSRITVPQSVAVAVAFVWLLVLCARGLLLLLDVRALAAIRRDARPWSAAYDYPVLVSDRVKVPIAAGFLRAAIILPASLVQRLPAGAVETIVIHGLAHLRRHDVWTNALARIPEASLALNPAAWFVMRRLMIEREVACDDWVVARTGTGDTFARTLAALATSDRPRALLAAAGALGSRHSVVVRIERLLDARPRRLRLSPPALGGALALLALIALTVQSVSPVLAYAAQPDVLARAATATSAAGSCPVPNQRIRMASILGIRRRMHDVPQEKFVLPDARTVVARFGAASVATFDLTVDAAGHPHKVVVASAPPYPGMAEHVSRIVMAQRYEPALRNCVPVAATIRTGVHFETPRANVYSIVTPYYPKGWSAQFTSACKVPTLQHSGVPGFPDAMRDMPVDATYNASVRVHVDAAGAVTNAAVVTSSGQRAFDDALLTTARKATYPLTESMGFKQARPSGAALSWNASHGSATYANCKPAPADYVWNTEFGKVVPIGLPGKDFVVLPR